MKKKNLIFLLGIIFTMMFSLSACGDKAEETTSQEDIEDISKDGEEENFVVDVSDDAEQTEEPTEEPTGVQPVHVLTGKNGEYHLSENYSTCVASITYPIIQLDEDCTAKYPELAQALVDLSDFRKDALTSEYEYMIEQAVIQIQEMGSEYFQPYESTELAEIRRADTNVVSILMDCYYYSGGVHGTPYAWGYTFDAKTGRELMLTDVVNDMSVLPQLVQAELDKYYEPETFFEEYDLNSYFTEYLGSVSWVLDYNGLTIIFNPYEIAPFASGSQVVTLSYAEYPDLVKAEYQQIPDSYAIELPESGPFIFDVDGDGTLDQLSVWGNVSEYDRIDKHVILVDDRRFEVETDGYDIDPVLVHMADGNNYLYIQDTTDNDYRWLSIYKFTADGAVEYVGELDNTGWYTHQVENEDYWGLQQVLTDPTEFRLEGRTDVLSTLSGYKNYQTSANGMPVSDDAWFTHTTERYLTVLQSVEADVIDENTGEKTGTTTLTVGTEVLYYRTDDASFADLKLEDGTVVRVMVNVDGWPRTIQGVDVETIFEGMMFAG